MLNKIRKIVLVFRLKLKYPNVIYFEAPFFVSVIGIRRRAQRKGFYSQLGQDAIIFSEFFQFITKSAFPKIFIDIGCNHPLIHSNSYFFENNQSYKVLAIDALEEMRDLWDNKRPNAEFVQCAVGEVCGEVNFNVLSESVDALMFSSVSEASNKGKAYASKNRKVKVHRLEEILKDRGIKKAGIVSIDIEGYELSALRGIDFNLFKAYIYVIENNNSNNGLGCNELRDFMISNGYIFFARIWGLDDIFVHSEVLAGDQGCTVSLPVL